ncbi:hypothetical protein PC110_g4590 [Phytophthora cactorum]|uniref:Tc1-like transposase DDE domain-containing protein n=3 Tax=Phytophthora cactorum TaxID=29920 RepID=A0A329SRJ5_9STRA|nr:hypothetical protein PC110_g4590 [Phytophthora cactorum]
MTAEIFPRILRLPRAPRRHLFPQLAQQIPDAFPAPSQAPYPEERRGVLDAYSSGGDWRAITRYNGFPRTTAEYLVGHGRAEGLPRGGARANKNLVVEDFNVKLTQTTISRHLIDMLCTIKQVRVEPTTCNNKGDLVVCFDETNYNLYTKRTRGRAKKGKRAIEKLPPSKGANLQIQCTVSSAFGVVAYRTHRGSIKMQTNTDFVEGLYKVIKESDVYKDGYTDKKIVVVFDNAPAHSQTESLVTKRDDLVLLRLGPYSPMCNPSSVL